MVRKLDKSEEESASKANNINVNEIKAELVEYMKKEIDIEIDDVVREKERKYIRAKSRKIFWLQIIILLLILIIIGGVVFLYKDHYFDKYFISNANETVEKEKNEEKEEPEEGKEVTEPVEKEEKEEEKKEEEPSLGELIIKHNTILDNIKLTSENDYLKDFYKGNYTDELKLSMATSLIDEDNLQEDDSFIIKREVIEKNYNKLFSSDINLVSFEYNGITFNYIKSLDTFIGSGTFKEGNRIIKEITAIEEDDDIVRVITKEYYSEDDKKYNPLTNKETEEEKVYEFKMVDGKYLINE